LWPFEGPTLNTKDALASPPPFARDRDRDVTMATNAAADLAADILARPLARRPPQKPTLVARCPTILEFSGGRSPSAAIPGYPASSALLSLRSQIEQHPDL